MHTVHRMYRQIEDLCITATFPVPTLTAMDAWVLLYWNISTLSTALSEDECIVCSVIAHAFGVSIIPIWCSVTVVCWENIHLNSRGNVRQYSHAVTDVAWTIINSAPIRKSTSPCTASPYHSIQLWFGGDLRFN